MSDPVDALYERNPGDFVGARNELVKALRRAGEKDRAAEVAKLRRPSVAAWAVNQLARRQRAELDELIGRGEELRSAHAGALAGGDPDALREAGRARRDAVARLVDLAGGILAEHGADADAHRSAIAATLDAASLDPEAAERVRQGRLASELPAPSGFGEVDLSSLPPPARRADRRTEEQAARQRAHQEAKERRAEAERAEARAAAARRRLEKAEGEVALAEHALNAARRRAREAAEEVTQAERAAAEALRDADRTAAALEG